MFLQFPQDVSQDLKVFFDEVNKELHLFDEKGLPVTLIQKPGVLEIKKNQDEVIITYQEKAHLFRALTFLKAHENETNYEQKETISFDEIGPMIDLSRNAVLSMDGCKRFILLMAKMGLNSCMLYMEDTYEIPEYPYFGHYRGRYSQKELKELDDYADNLGVTLIPSIQTLGHLKNPLKWNFASGMKDSDDILLVGEEKTYKFIEAALRSIASCFRSKKVHIGMDEAHQLGRGVYLDKHGLKDRFEIMTEHLQKVVELCNKYDLDPMMWSDMFFRIASKTGDYYDTNAVFPPSLIEKMPKVDMVYWDYYHHDKESYDKLFALHHELKQPVVFAGGVWTWNGLAPNYGKSLATTKAALKSCKEQHIKQVYATLWGDDGAEAPFISALFGLQYFAEEQFSNEVTDELVAEHFTLCHDLNAEDFLALDEFDQTPGVAKDNPEASNASKLALYQDVLFGLYEKTLGKWSLKEHYEKLQEKLNHVKKTPDTKAMFDFYQQLAKVLVLKVDLPNEISKAYKNQDKVQLQHLIEVTAKTKVEMEKLHDAHQTLWLAWNNPFGLEILDMRYGGVVFRLQYAINRLTQYLNGELPNIPELEAPRLEFDGPYMMGDGIVGRNLFYGIYSPGKLSDV